MTPAAPLRCHLLIGPPASGKSTLAAAMAATLQARVLSTEAIHGQIHGDSGEEGDPPRIEALLHEQLQQAVAEGVSVIVDATHAYRPRRLALTQALPLPRPVEWVGWWLTTPLDTCKAWNASRRGSVPESVIDRHHRALRHRHFGPSTDEGMACVVKLDPSALSKEGLPQEIAAKLKGLPKRISGCRNRTSGYELHGYSRLLDMERLLYLMALLLRYPGLEAVDERSRAELRRLCNPLPLSEDPAVRAAAFLRSHGECYADEQALRADLAWLAAQGFTRAESVRTPVEPPPAPAELAHQLGGWPRTANRDAFRRVMTLLRHVPQNPFDHDREDKLPLAVHLVQQMADIEGAYVAGPLTRKPEPEGARKRKKRKGDPEKTPAKPRWKCGESDTLLKDLDRLWTAYGLRQTPGERHGYTLGTALFTAPRLLELHGLVRQTADRLQDPTAQDLFAEFKQRLLWAGLAVDDVPPVRAYANRSIVGTEHVPAESLAVAQQAEKLEAAILAGERVKLERYGDAARFEDQPRFTETLQVWPLQLLFHNIGWYLAFEVDGGTGPGLIRTERLDRLRWVRVDRSGRDARSAQERRQAIGRLERLLHHCSGIFFGTDLQAQLDLCSDDPEQCRKPLRTLRVRCKDWVFSFLREGVQRFPVEHTRLSRPLPTDTWRHRPTITGQLDPLPGDSHPYPVEIDMPFWTVEKDVDLKRWIFGFGDGIVIEAPESLARRRVEEARKVIAASGLEGR